MAVENEDIVLAVLEPQIAQQLERPLLRSLEQLIGGASGFDSMRVEDGEGERGAIVPVGVRSTGPDEAVSKGF